MDFRTVLTIIASSLVFIGYGPYVRDTLKGKTKPHAYSWLVGVIVTAISAAGQVYGHAGIATLVLVFVTLLTFVILLLSLKYGVRHGTRLDKTCLLFCLLALPFWAVSKNPLVTVVLVNIIDAVGFIPTLTKAHKYPYSETMFSYQMNVIRFALVILAVSHYTLINLMYPVTWFICNSIFVVLISSRRKQGKGMGFAG